MSKERIFNETITVESEDDGPPVSTLTGTVDQAALQGLLHSLQSRLRSQVNPLRT